MELVAIAILDQAAITITTTMDQAVTKTIQIKAKITTTAITAKIRITTVIAANPNVVATDKIIAGGKI